MSKKILALIVVGLIMASPNGFAAQEAPESTTAKPMRQLRFFALGPRTGHVATHMNPLSLPPKPTSALIRPPGAGAMPGALALPAASASTAPNAPMTQEQAKQMLSIFPDAR